MNTLKNGIEAIIEYQEINLKDKLPDGYPNYIAEIFNIPKTLVNRYLHYIRREKAISTKGYKEVYRTSETELREICLKAGLIRNSPDKEAAACATIMKYIKELPNGGAGIILGTPTAFCASLNRNYPMLIMDNFETAIVLKHYTSIPLTIVIGNAINEKRAQVKAQHWKSNNITNSSTIIVDKVDSYSFYNYISKFAEKHSLVKVILMTSGVWIYCKRTRSRYKKKYGIDDSLDLNFERPSIELTNKYKNLHIFAMTKETKVGFDIRYLHDGKNEIVR